MKTKKPVSMSPGHTHSFQTPPYALEPILSHIAKFQTLWEPACGKGYLVDALIKHKHKVKWSDIERDPKEDFLKYVPKQGFDCIVTNPPYDIKDKFIFRCYQLGKPWAMLMPLTALEGKFRQSLYRQFGLEVIFMNKRINFETPNDGKSSWFATAWFTWKLNIGKEMTFYEFT